MPISTEIINFKTTNGTRVFRLPLEAFPNFQVFAYLVDHKDGLFLIDSGSGSDLSNQGLAHGFEQVSDKRGTRIEIKDLSEILLTHGHIDHMGGLVFLKERSQARIGVHELDFQTIARHEERLALMNMNIEHFLVNAGIESEEREGMLQLYRFTKAFFHSVPVDFTFEQSSMEKGPFSIVHLPGHCPGQVAFRLEDLVFSGDHILSETTTHQSPESLMPYLGLGHYLDSVEKFNYWAGGSRLILAGHGQPISNLRERSAFILNSIRSRLKQCLAFLDEPHCMHEVSRNLYGEIKGYNALLVLEKTGAYIEFLYQHGMLEITNVDELETSNQAVIRYRRSTDKADLVFSQKERTYVFI